MSIFDVDMSAGSRKVGPFQGNSNTANSLSEKTATRYLFPHMKKRMACEEGQTLSFFGVLFLFIFSFN